MTRRLIVLAALVAALAVPAISLADDGGSTPAPTTTHDGSKISAALDRASARLDKRFAAFSSRCLVANAPERCAKAANRAVRRMDRAQAVLTKLENKIKTKCSAASGPALCANVGTITGKIDALRSKLQSDEAAIKATYPNAGSGKSAAPTQGPS